MRRRPLGPGGALLGLGAVVLQACAPAAPARSGAVFEAHWSGADSGSIRGRATARWCPDGRFAELLGLRGDTGVAIAVRRLDSLVPGRYPAVLPDSADTASPSATVGLRFLARTAVSGYQSDSGSVTLERGADGALDARFEVRARVVGAAARIRLRGTATAVPVERGGDECTTPWRASE
jgi:hypothetical protein